MPAESRGKVSTALRLESGQLVEVREGALAATGQRGAVFEARDAVASGWIGDASQLLLELRRGVIEPVPAPGLRPQIAVAALPAAKAAGAEDRYATNIEVPVVSGGGFATEAAEIEAWSALSRRQAGGRLRLRGHPSPGRDCSPFPGQRTRTPSFRPFSKRP